MPFYFSVRVMLRYLFQGLANTRHLEKGRQGIDGFFSCVVFGVVEGDLDEGVDHHGVRNADEAFEDLTAVASAGDVGHAIKNRFENGVVEFTESEGELAHFFNRRPAFSGPLVLVERQCPQSIALFLRCFS